MKTHHLSATHHRIVTIMLAGFIAALLAPHPAQAANNTWDGGGAGPVWQGSVNWAGDVNVPGTAGITNNQDTATFNAPIANTWGNSATNAISIDNSRNIKSISFTGAAGSYFIGNTSGNTLSLTAGGTTQILSTIVGPSLKTETINAPLRLLGDYTFANNSASGTGATTGILNIGGQVVADGSGPLATLTLSGSNTNANTISGDIFDLFSPLALTKSGNGTWVLAGNNSYAGLTTVSSGTLLVNGTNSSGNAFVQNGGTLGGSGSISTFNSIILNAGAKLSPGGAAGATGTLEADVGSGTFDISAGVSATNSQSMLFNLTTTGASDKVVVTSGSLNIDPIGTGLEFDDFAFTTGAGFGVGTYTLFDTSASIVGTLGANLSGILGGLNAAISLANSSQDIVLTVTAVPEPATCGALAGLALAGLCVTSVIRRRSKKLAV